MYIGKSSSVVGTTFPTLQQIVDVSRVDWYDEDKTGRYFRLFLFNNQSE
jgi:hypothetical protein